MVMIPAKATKGQMQGLSGLHWITAVTMLLDKKFQPKVVNTQAKLDRTIFDASHDIITKYRTDLKDAQSDLDDASMRMIEFFDQGI